MPKRIVAGATLLAVSIAWLAIGLGHVWSAPVVGWLPSPLLALLAAYGCYQVTRRRELAAGTRQFWGQITVAAVLLAFAVTSNAYDAVGGPEPTTRITVRTMVLYLLCCLTILTAVVRLPTWRRSRGDWARFALDAGVVLITNGELIWYFSLRNLDVWTSRTGSAVPVLAIGGACSVSMIAFIKLAFAGAGRLDRGALRILSAAGALAAAAGGLTPALSSRPYLSSCFAAVPIAAFAVQLAAHRQARSSAEPPAERPVSRRLSVVPYLAVATTDLLLLLSGTTDAGEARILALCAVAVTALVVLRQITALRDNGRLLSTIDHQVTHDALTQIANRGLFERTVTAELTAGRRFHLALLDLDDFKVVNDRLGHGTGDALLKAISTRLLQTLRDDDTVARLGGDEFTLLLPGLTDTEADVVLRRLIDAVQQPLLVAGHDMMPRISVGVTVSADVSPEELIRRADVAMYAAKTLGGGRSAWFDPAMDRTADADARLGADLRLAITRGELTVLYQPIVELPHGRLAGVEALVRWRHPVLGYVSPATFIPLAERNGYIVELGRWILEQVMLQAARWETRFGALAPERISVNISARQLHEPGFAAEVGRLLHEHHLDPARLVAEVTETAVLGTGPALAAVHELHGMGLRVALDDFGTGQSSLSLLVDCPVNILKVDKSFVDGTTLSGPQAVIVDKLIGITDGLRILAVAEGVETEAQALRLHEVGYRYAQGFHFAHPMPGAAIDQLLAGAEIA